MRSKVIAALVVVTALMGASTGVALATSRPSGIPAFAAKTPGTPAGGPMKIFVTPNNGAGGIVKSCGSARPADHAATSSPFTTDSTSTPFRNVAPARTRATSAEPLT